MLLQNNREKKHQNVKATYKKEEQSVIWWKFSVEFMARKSLQTKPPPTPTSPEPKGL